jgi:hypothetical protein
MMPDNRDKSNASFGVSGRTASGDALPTLYYTPGIPDLDAPILDS